MKLIPLALTALTASLLILSCANKTDDKTAGVSTFDLEKAKITLQGHADKFCEAWAKLDSNAIANAYTKDALALPPNYETVKKDAMLAFWGAGLRMYAPLKLSIKLNELMGDENMLVENSTYELTDTTGKVVDKGKTLVVWKQEDGTWKMHRDMWSSDLPVPPAK